MIALDTNLLIYAHREESAWHEAASAAVARLAEGRSAWAIPWPCIHEFLAVVTHARIFDPPTPLAKALDQVDAWLESPSLTLLSESEGYWARLRVGVVSGRITGAHVHDARVASLCLHHGVEELWSADRDFGRFPGLTVRNPLVG
ncbi:MAG: type II toxin-antitoxin system VapC family toxin [Thermoanaerobaculia bacterium]